MKMQGNVYYLGFGKDMIKDIEKAIKAGAKVAVGYDGEVKLWYVRPKRR